MMACSPPQTGDDTPDNAQSTKTSGNPTSASVDAAADDTAADTPSAMNSGPILTPERIMADPGLSGPSPRGLRFSPDGSIVTFLQGKSDNQNVLDLWSIPSAGGEPSLLVDSSVLSPDPATLSEEEKARRERQRIMARGIISYSWDAKGERILVPLDGDLYAVDIATGTAQQLTNTPAYEIDAKVSPTGAAVSFVRDATVFAVDLTTGVESQLTPAGEGAVSYGVAEFVAQEEMGRYTGYWWSGDDGYLAYTKVDESDVVVFDRVDIDASGATIIQQRYPFTGTTNATVQLFVRDMASGDVVEVDLGPETDIYLTRVNWLGDQLIVQRQNRAQTVIDVMAIDPTTGEGRVLFSETADTWLNLHNNFRPIADNSAFLWTSERTGFSHIYHVSADGQTQRQITNGDWVVDTILAVDEAAGLVYFDGFMDTPLERHVYAVSYTQTDAEPVRMTAAGSYWNVTLNADATAFIGTSSSPTQPSQTGLYAMDGTLVRWLEENALTTEHPYAPYLAQHVIPEFGVLQAEDGTDLHYSLLKPAGCSAANPCPVILEVYGGPGVQRVTRSWGAASPHSQMFVQNGFALMRLDNRGATNRGKAFEDAIYRRMGDVEVRDQLVAASYLQSLDFIDADRMGVMGWSYGGYMTLMLLSQAPDVFIAGVSGAPVSDWTLYDTHYTERFLGTPADNAAGYEASSVFPYLDDMQVPVLIIHGMADDNVIFDHATRAFDSLQSRGHVFESMVYPGERHGVYGAREHVIATRLDYFLRRLK